MQQEKVTIRELSDRMQLTSDPREAVRIATKIREIARERKAASIQQKRQPQPAQ